MSKTLQLKRGNTSISNSYTGSPGEVTVDTTNWDLRVHDGVTAGGWVVDSSNSGGSFGNVTVSGDLTANNIIANNDIDASGNITANYFIGNGSQLTGLPQGYTDSDVITLLGNLNGNIIPSGNATYNLGNVSNQWKELWVSNNTIYIGGVPIGISGNTLTVGGEPVLSNDSNSSITTTGNISASYFIGDGSQLTGLSFSYGNANVSAYLPTYSGNILVDRVIGNTTDNLGYLQWVGNSSGDLNGYTTMRLVPDDTLVENDQYLIVDPTDPYHIHIRAGGTQDSSQAELFLGGESNYVRVSDSSGIRLQNQTRNDLFYSYSDPGTFNTGSWYEDNGVYFVQYTTSDTELVNVTFQFNNDNENTLLVYYNGGANTTELTSDGSVSNLGGGVYRVSVNEAPPTNPTVITAFDYTIWTNRTNSVQLQSNDFTVSVTDDIRITGNDTFSLRNESTSEPITIHTDYNDNNYSWEFDATGNLTTPGDITVAGDITGTSSARTLVLKADPVSNTSIQLNDTVESIIRTVSNLEIRTDSSDTDKIWTFDASGDLTVPNYIYFKDGTFMGDEGGAGTPVFRIDSPVGLGINLTTESDISGNNYTWSFGIDGNLTAPGNIFVTGNIASGNILTDNYYFANGDPFISSNYNDSNVVNLLSDFGSNSISTTGNVVANYFLGNGSQLTGVSISGISNGTTAVRIPLSDGSVVFDVDGFVDIMDVNSDGLQVWGANANIDGNLLVGGYASITGNVTASENITSTGDVTGKLLKSTNSVGDEGGEIQLVASENATIGGVIIDSYNDIVRIFENGGSSRGVRVDLTKTPANNVGELIWKVSDVVDAGTFVTLDNLTVTVPTSGNRGLSVASTSGSFFVNIGAWYGGSGGTGGTSINNLEVTTTPSVSLFDWNFVAEGNTAQYTIYDKTNNRMYRVTLMIGPAYLDNFISIERLI